MKNIPERHRQTDRQTVGWMGGQCQTAYTHSDVARYF